MARTNRKYSRKISRRTSRKTNRKSRRRRKRKEIKRKKSLQKGGMDALVESGKGWVEEKYAAGKKMGSKAGGLVSRGFKAASDEKLKDGDTKLEISGTFLKAAPEDELVGGGKMRKRRFTFIDDQNVLKWESESGGVRMELLFNSFVVKEDPSSILGGLGGAADDRFDRGEFLPYLSKFRDTPGKFNPDNDLLLFKKGAPWDKRQEGEPLHFRFESSKYRDIFYSVFDAQRDRTAA